MTISELNLTNIRDVISEIRLTKTNESTIQDVYISFDTFSKNKLSQLISTGKVTRDNQKLTIDSLLLKQEYEELLTKDQSPWIKTSNGFALSAKTISLPHFSANFTALATDKKDSTMFYAIEFSIDNFSLDFTNSRKNFLDKEVEFENVGMIVYPGNISAKVVED